MKKLFKAGFGEHWHYVAGDDMSDAIRKVKEIDHAMSYLPAVATEVVEETGYKVFCTNETLADGTAEAKEDKETSFSVNVITFSEEETEVTAEIEPETVEEKKEVKKPRRR